MLALLQASVVTALARRVAVSERVRRAYLGLLAAGAALVLVLALVHIGNPVTFVARATDSFTSDRATTGGHLGSRFTRLASDNRSGYWRIAWHEVRDHPVLGGGANEFRRYWLRYRPNPYGALNAHNLYLETLADLGPVGLVLLLAALAVPLVAAVRARARPLVAAVAGAYVAFLGAAALDWDWQLPAVTLAALACGTALVAAARPEDVKRGRQTGACASRRSPSPSRSRRSSSQRRSGPEPSPQVTGLRHAMTSGRRRPRRAAPRPGCRGRPPARSSSARHSSPPATSRPPAAPSWARSPATTPTGRSGSIWALPRRAGREIRPWPRRNGSIPSVQSLQP